MKAVYSCEVSFELNSPSPGLFLNRSERCNLFKWKGSIGGNCDLKYELVYTIQHQCCVLDYIRFQSRELSSYLVDVVAQYRRNEMVSWY